MGSNPTIATMKVADVERSIRKPVWVTPSTGPKILGLLIGYRGTYYGSRAIVFMPHGKQWEISMDTYINGGFGSTDLELAKGVENTDEYKELLIVYTSFGCPVILVG